MKLDPAIGKFLGPALSAVAAAWVMRAMIQASRRQAAQTADGAFELRYPRWYAWTGVLAGLLGAAIMIGGALTSQGRIGGLLLTFGAGGAMAAGGVWMTLEMLRRVIRVYPDRVEMTDLHGEVHRIDWATVTKVRFRRIAGYLVIEGPAGTTVQASLALAGLQSLIDRLKAAVPHPLWAQAMVDLEEYRKRQTR